MVFTFGTAIEIIIQLTDMDHFKTVGTLKPTTKPISLSRFDFNLRLISREKTHITYYLLINNYQSIINIKTIEIKTLLQKHPSKRENSKFLFEYSSAIETGFIVKILNLCSPEKWTAFKN